MGLKLYFSIWTVFYTWIFSCLSIYFCEQKILKNSTVLLGEYHYLLNCSK